MLQKAMKSNKLLIQIKKLLPNSVKKLIKPIYYYLLSQLEYYEVYKETKSKSYLKWYQEHCDNKIDNMIISNADKKSGKIDLNLCKKLGLKPNNKVLDFGCGYLRAGHFFIKYLNNGNYTGADTSKNRIELGKKTFLKHLNKNPMLFTSNSNSLHWLKGEKYDYIYSHSVISHLPVEHVQDVLLNMKKKVMHKRSCIIASVAILNFSDYRGYFEKLDIQSRIDEIKKHHIKQDYLRTFNKLKNNQNQKICQTSIVNWYWSKTYFKEFTNKLGFICEDVTMYADDINFDLYNPWVRLFKLTLK